MQDFDMTYALCSNPSELFKLLDVGDFAVVETSYDAGEPLFVFTVGEVESDVIDWMEQNYRVNISLMRKEAIGMRHRSYVLRHPITIPENVTAQQRELLNHLAEAYGCTFVPYGDKRYIYINIPDKLPAFQVVAILDQVQGCFRNWRYNSRPLETSVVTVFIQYN